MSLFDHLTDTDKARHALEAINRVLAGSRMREGDHAALMHAYELMAAHVPPTPREVSPKEPAFANDFFDRLATGQSGRGDGL